MKHKWILLMLLAAGTALPAAAQQADTLRGRDARYYYQSWYDECHYYDEPNQFVIGNFMNFAVNNVSYYGPGDLLAARVNVPRCMKLAGVAVMVTEQTSITSFTALSDGKADEYVTLFDGSSDPGVAVATARWDTAAARTMVLSQDRQRATAGGGEGDMVFKVHEAMFETPVTVSEAFYLAGSFNSNRQMNQGMPPVFETAPTFYAMVHNEYTSPCNDCIPATNLMGYNADDDMWWMICHECEYSGPFIPIPAMVGLAVASDSLELGSVEGGGTYRSGDPAVIHATAAEGCRFVGWNDGNTDNPRVVYLCGDTAFTARFVNDSSHLLRVLPNDTSWGYVYGTGVYHHGSVAVISATPRPGYRFMEWADYDQATGLFNVDNPRHVTVGSDTVFTALFDLLPQGIPQAPAAAGVGVQAFTIHPNPAHDKITVTAAAAGRYTLRLYDGRGRMVTERRFEGESVAVDVRDLPSGLYMVSLQAAGHPEAKTFIKL